MFKGTLRHAIEVGAKMSQRWAQGNNGTAKNERNLKLVQDTQMIVNAIK